MTDVGHGGSPSIEQPDYWWYLARTDLLHAALSEFADGRTTVLDIGSADGPSAGWLHDGRRRLASLDIDPRGLRSNGVCGSALALPFAEGSFDMVSAFDVIEHCDPEAEALAEVHRVLAPGGRLLMAVPAYQWAWTDFDVANGHFRRDLTTAPRDWTPGAVIASLKAHSDQGAGAAHGYNPVQRILYGMVFGVLMPLMLFTGLAISPGFQAVAPWLLDLLGGRQSARSLHFITSWAIFGFVVIHLVLALTNWRLILEMFTGGKRGGHGKAPPAPPAPPEPDPVPAEMETPAHA